jgi:hypothetical protein
MTHIGVLALLLSLGAPADAQNVGDSALNCAVSVCC